MWLGLSLLFVWSRFVEPQWLHVRESTVAGTGIQADVALISDLHIGFYKSSGFLARVVERINGLPVQYVLIAGDFSYEPDADSLGACRAWIADSENRPQRAQFLPDWQPHSPAMGQKAGEKWAAAVDLQPATSKSDRLLDALFAPLRQLNVPVFAVLGNHDQQAPGPDIDRPLRAALNRLGVQIIEGRVVDMDGWQLAGLGDHWGGNDDPGPVESQLSSAPTLWLIHNPDSAMRLKPEQTRLALAGHTHCGQIRIPWLYRRVSPSSAGFDCGLQTAHTPRGDLKVFISPGLGEIGLPMRLLNPPTIDWLHLRP
jgi:predicted MPP superfamily phosphohydrolase